MTTAAQSFTDNTAAIIGGVVAIIIAIIIAVMAIATVVILKSCFRRDLSIREAEE